MSEPSPLQPRALGTALQRYAMAIASTLIAWGITCALWRWINPNPGAFIFLAIVATAWFARLGPALVASVLGTILAGRLVPLGDPNLQFAAGDLLRGATYVLTAVLISWLNDARDRADRALADSDRLRAHLEEQSYHLQAANERLQREVAQRQRAQDETLLHQRHLRRLASELAITQERERREIASQLHDGMGQTLAIAQMKVDALRASRAVASDPALATTAADALALLRSSIDHARTLTRQLSPPVLYEAGFEPAVEWLADHFRRDHRLQVDVSHHGPPGGLQLSEDLRVVLFQAVRELLMNVVKHAGTDRAHVTTFRRPDSLRVVVEDEGRGLDPARLAPASSDGYHYGLLNVRERLTYLGGQFEIESEPGQGARFLITVPFPPTPGRAAGNLQTQPTNRSSVSSTTDATVTAATDPHAA